MGKSLEMQYREYRRKEVEEEGWGRGREQGRSEEKRKNSFCSLS